MPKRDFQRDFDHTDPEYLELMHSVGDELRTTCPVANGTAHGGFSVLSRYEDVRAAWRDTDSYSSAQGVTIPHIGTPYPAIPTESDPPEHRLYRKLIQPWLEKHVVPSYEDDVRDMVTELLDALVGEGHFDLVAELAVPLPPMVIARVIGLPPREWPTFRDLVARIMTTTATGDATANAAVWAEFVGYLVGKIDQRRSSPQDDMLSTVAHGDINGQPLSHDQAVGLLITLVMAGLETSTMAIGNLALHLAQHPELQRHLVENPEAIPAVIEESLRIDSPVQIVGRVMTRDVTIAGTTIPRDRRVALNVGAANRDSTVFDRPHEFVAERNPNRHVAFGFGVHQCAGNWLARMEIRVVFEEMLRRMPNFRLDGEPKRYFEIGITYGMASLPIAFDVAATVSGAS